MERFWDAWGWYSAYILLRILQMASDIHCFEILLKNPREAAPTRNSMIKLIAIRAIGGHRSCQIDINLFNRVKNTDQIFSRLYHGTKYSALESIFLWGLWPGGLIREG